jgi:hypothetical protein
MRAKTARAGQAAGFLTLISRSADGGLTPGGKDPGDAASSVDPQPLGTKPMTSATLIAVAGTLVMTSTLVLDATSAAEQVRHAGRNVTYPKSVEFTEKDAERQRAAGSFVREGLTFHTEGPRAGEISMIVIEGTFDFVGGVGPYQASILRTFEDGETVTVEIEGETTQQDGGRVSLGDYQCVDGTGSLEGVVCEGSYTSTPFANRMTLVDWEGVVSAPDGAP